MQLYLAFLDCTDRDDAYVTCAIYVARLPSTGQWARVRNDDGDSIFFRRWTAETARTTRRNICMRNEPQETPVYHRRAYGFWLRTLELPYHDQYETVILSRLPTSQHDRVYLQQGQRGTAGVAAIVSKSRRTSWCQVYWIKVGFDAEFTPRAWVANGSSQSFPSPKYFQTQIDKGLAGDWKTPPMASMFNNDWLHSDVGFDAPDVVKGWQYGNAKLTFDDPLSENARRSMTWRELGIRLTISLFPDCAPDKHPAGEVSSVQHSQNPKFIWTLDFEKLQTIGPSLETRHLGYQCLAVSKIAAGTVGFFLLSGCPDHRWLLGLGCGLRSIYMWQP